MKFLYAVLIFFGMIALLYGGGFLVFRSVFPRDKAPEKTLERFLKRMRKRGKGHIADRVQKDMSWLDENGYEEVSFDSFDKKKLFARFYKNPQPCGKTIVLVHGYRSSAAFDFGSVCPFLFSLGCNLLAIDQRAHGKSEGEYCTLGVAERFDAIGWADWVKENLGEDEGVILYGASMGATSVLLASGEVDELPENVIGVIADSAYIGPMMELTLVLRKKHIPSGMLMNIVELFCMLKGRFSMKDCTTTNAMPHCMAPVLFLHGEADRLVPHDDSRINYEQCAARSEFLLIPDAEHTRGFITDEETCSEAIAAFIESLEGPPSPERELRKAELPADDDDYEYDDDEYEYDDDEDEEEEELDDGDDEYEDDDDEDDDEYDEYDDDEYEDDDGYDEDE